MVATTTKSFCKTLWLMMMQHRTKFGHKRIVQWISSGQTFNEVLNRHGDPDLKHLLSSAWLLKINYLLTKILSLRSFVLKSGFWGMQKKYSPKERHSPIIVEVFFLGFITLPVMSCGTVHAEKFVPMHFITCIFPLH